MLRLVIITMLAMAALTVVPTPAQAAACEYSYERFYDAGVYVGCQVPYGGPECKVWALIYWDPLPEADCAGEHIPPPMPYMCTFTQNAAGVAAECTTENYEPVLGCDVAVATWDPARPEAGC